MEPDPNSPEVLAAKRLSLLRRDFSVHQEKLLALNKFLLQVKEHDALLDASRAKGKGVTELPSSSRFFHVYIRASFCLGKSKLMLDVLGDPDE